MNGKSTKQRKRLLKNQSRVNECNSKDGITIGLIDSIITQVNILAKRLKSEENRFKKSKNEFEYHSDEVLGALQDLKMNKSLKNLMYPYDEKAMRIIEAAANTIKCKSS